MSSENLGAVCSGLLRIIPEQLAGLVRLTSDTREIVEGSVTVFSFLARSFWHKPARLDGPAAPVLRLIGASTTASRGWSTGTAIPHTLVAPLKTESLS